MPLFDYRCRNKECGHVQEYLIFDEKEDSPKKCEKCGYKKPKKDTNANNFASEGIDVLGGYEYTYGKKNWKKGKSNSEIADVLNSKKDPW